MMAQPAVSAIDSIEFAQPRWSLRRRMAFIIAAAAGSWALAIGLAYGLSRILF
jgi:hypothetical protein